jgi:predicted RNA-binding protein YlqC (UPF0109 family)
MHDDDDDRRGDDPEDRLEDLIIYVARNLVDEPDDVAVEAIEGDRAIIYELSVAPGDLGKVIGKDGRTARAMRTLLAATSAKLRKRAVLDIVE